MQYNEFEKNIAQQLSTVESPVDTEALLQKIFIQEPKKRKKPLFLLWFILGVISVIGLGIYLASTTEFEVLKVAPVSKVISQSKQLISNAENSEISAIQSDNTPTKTTTISHQSKGSIVEDKASKNKFAHESIALSNFHHNNTYKTKSDIENHELPVNQEVIPSLSNPSEVKIESMQSPVFTSSPLLSIFSKELLTQKALNAPDYQPHNGCPSFKKKNRLAWSLIPEVGLFKPSKTLENKLSVENKPVALRQQNENTLEGLHAAIYAKLYKRKSPWNIKVGVAYERIAERMNLSETKFRKDTTIGIISITKSQNGDTLTIIQGPIITETKTTTKIISHYYHHLVSLPLSIGYQRQWGQLEYGIDAGVQFNLFNIHEGNIYSDSLDFRKLNDVGYFRNNVGMTFFGSINVAYPFTTQQSIGASIRTRFNNPVYSQNQANFSQKYQITGVYLQYEYRF